MFAYKLTLTTDGESDEIVYLYQKEAERHRDHVLSSPWYTCHRDEWKIEPIEIDTIARQSVNITGDSVGYMFSNAWHQGRRTVRRVVRGLSYDVRSNQLTGVIRWSGRLVRVTKPGPGLMWQASHVVGYV